MGQDLIGRGEESSTQLVSVNVGLADLQLTRDVSPNLVQRICGALQHLFRLNGTLERPYRLPRLETDRWTAGSLSRIVSQKQAESKWVLKLTCAKGQPCHTSRIADQQTLCSSKAFDDVENMVQRSWVNKCLLGAYLAIVFVPKVLRHLPKPTR